MPVFPRYESRGQLTTQQPAVQAIADTSGQILENKANAGQAVSQTAAKYSDHLGTMQQTVFKANANAFITDLQARADQDPEPNNLGKYQKELQQYKQQNLKGFVNKSAESMAGFEFDYSAKIADIQLSTLFKKKQIVVTQTAAMKNIDDVISNPNMSFQGKNNAINDVLQAQIKSGTFDSKTAAEVYNKSVKTLVEFDVSNDLSNQEGQSEVLAELRKGDAGRYANVPASERLDLIKATQQRIFNNNQTFKRDVEDSQNVRSNSLIEKFAGGDITIKDIEAEEAIPEESGGIKRKQLLTYKNAIMSGVKGDLDRMLKEKTPGGDPTKRAKDVQKYLELVDNFTDSKTDQWKAKEMLASAFEDGIINSKEQQFLNGIKQNLKDIEFNRSTGPVANAIRGVKDFMRVQANASDEDIARNIKSMVGDIGSGTRPEEAARKILQQEIINKIPDLTTYPKTGKIKRDANGNKVRIFPDGTYEEIDGKEIA